MDSVCLNQLCVCVHLVLLLSHLIGYSLCELGLWDRCWLLGGQAAVAEPFSECLVGFLQHQSKKHLTNSPY